MLLHNVNNHAHVLLCCMYSPILGMVNNGLPSLTSKSASQNMTSDLTWSLTIISTIHSLSFFI
jgi:hypothetical protein